MTSRILVMRHAEKTGDPADPHLSPAGHARAQRLADFIPETFGVPKYLVAASASKHSNRCIETMQPLSTKIAVPIDTSIADQDYGILAHQLRSQPRYLEEGTLTLVCWHHGNIPSLVHALGATSNSFSDPWDANVFNEILVLTYMGSSVPDLSIVTEGF